jgi:hypothetical protein
MQTTVVLTTVTAKKARSSRHRRFDPDLHKGAMESDSSRQKGNTSLYGQLGHRTEDEMVKANDSDFPEPGSNPEHSGEPEEKKNPEGVTQSQEPGHRQKRNQGNQREDPLAS